MPGAPPREIERKTSASGDQNETRTVAGSASSPPIEQLTTNGKGSSNVELPELVLNMRSGSVDQEEIAPPLSISRSASRAPEGEPLDLMRSVSRQSQNVPAWMSNDMTSLSKLARTVSLPKTTTPRPPPSSFAADDSDAEDQQQQQEEEESRMLRHLEQHAHMQEEMDAEDVMNPQRAEQIQRENDRLLHIQLRRDRNARNRSRSTAEQESFSPPSPLLSGLADKVSDDEEGFKVRKTGEDNGGTTSRRSGFFGLWSFDEPARPATPSHPASPINVVEGDGQLSGNTPRNRRPGGESAFFGEGDERIETRESPNLGASTPRPRSRTNDGVDGDGLAKAEGTEQHSPTRLARSVSYDSTPGSPGTNKSKVMGFGFARRASSGLVNLSSRRQNISGSAKKKLNHLPPSFTGARQRARLVELLRQLDLEDATLLDAIKKIRPLHPQGVLRRNWDKLLAIGVLYTIIAVPVEVAFDSYDVPFRVIGVFLDIIFILDIALTFRTSYREVNDEYVRDFDQIARNYLKTWFTLDVIAAIPVNIIFIIVASAVSPDVQSYVSLFKLIKIFRIVRLRHLFYSLAGLRLSAALYLFLFIGAFVVSAHWLACILWKIADLENDAGEISWALLQKSLPDIFSRSATEQYSTAFYWAMATITTLGYGDIHAWTYAEQVFLSIAVVIGATLYASVIGLVSFIMRSQFDTELQRENHSASLRSFGRQYHLPLDLQHRIRSYYNFLWERKKRFSSRSLVNDLPLELRADVADSVHRKLMDSNPVLRACTTFGFKKLLAARLTPSTVRIPEDVLYFEGDSVNEVFFIKKGVVEIVFGLDRGADAEFVVSRRADGQHLGDMGLFVETVQRGRAGSTVREDDPESATNGDDFFVDLDSADEDSEDETEYSPAQHFSLDNRTGATSKRKRRQLHHTSAVVTEFSEISSILASDFTQLLRRFPRERKLFRAAAIARYKRVQQLVATRLALLNSASSNSLPAQLDPSFEPPAAGDSPSGRFGTPALLTRAISSTRNAFAGHEHPPPIQHQLSGAVAADFHPESVAEIKESTPSPSLRSAMVTLGWLSPSASKHDRRSHWRKTWQRNVSPEMDNELITQAVDRFLKDEKRRSQQRSSSPTTTTPFARIKRTMKKPLKASEYLLSPIMKPRKLESPSSAQTDTAKPPEPQPLIPHSILKASSYKVPVSGVAPVGPDVLGRARSRSENFPSVKSDDGQPTHVLKPHSYSTGVTPSQSRRHRRLSLSLPGEVPGTANIPSLGPQGSDLGRSPASPRLSMPTTHSQTVEQRLRGLLEKVQRLEAEVDDGLESRSPLPPEFGYNAPQQSFTSLRSAEPNLSRRPRKRNPMEASLSEAHLQPLPLGASSTSTPATGTSSSTWRKRQPNLGDVRGLI